MKDKKKEAARVRARKSRLRAKVKSGKATRAERAELRELLEVEGEPPFLDPPSKRRLPPGVTEEAPSEPGPELEAGSWSPAGGAPPPEEAPPAAPPPPPTEEASPEAPPPALPEAPPEVTPPREVSPEEAERGVAVVGMLVAMGVAQTVAAAKRLVMAGAAPAQLAPLVMSCDEGRTAAISAVVATATANVLRRYGGGAVRYTDEAIVAVACLAMVGVNVAAARLPPPTPEEEAAARKATEEVRAAEAAARDRFAGARSSWDGM